MSQYYEIFFYSGISKILLKLGNEGINIFIKVLY